MVERERERQREREKERERKREEADELGLFELKAKLVSAGLLMYWIALNSCTRRKREKEGRKRERERQREREKERRGRWVRTYGASSRPSLYPVELLLYWAALNTCTNPEESGKKESREREREKERKREREKEWRRREKRERENERTSPTSSGAQG